MKKIKIENVLLVFHSHCISHTTLYHHLCGWLYMLYAVLCLSWITTKIHRFHWTHSPQPSLSSHSVPLFLSPSPHSYPFIQTVCVEYDRSCCHHWGFYSGHCLVLHSILRLKCGFKIQCTALSHQICHRGVLGLCPSALNFSAGCYAKYPGNILCPWPFVKCELWCVNSQ